MKTLSAVAAAFLVLSLALIGSPVGATTVSGCQALISEIRTETGSVQFLARNAARDQAGLLAKLDAAWAKIDQVKFSDAIQKLADYKKKVLALMAAGKIGPSADFTATPDMLVHGADDAVACIQQIGW